MISNIFYNTVERRPRAFWRLLAQLVIFFVINILLSIPVGIAAGVLTAAAGGNLTDPQVIQGLNRHPLVQGASGITSVIAMFVSFWVAARWLDRRPMRDFGFRLSKNWWADFGFGMALGAILLAFVFAFELAAGWITITGTMVSFIEGIDFWTGIAGYLILFLCVGIYEEMLSRGYHLRNIAEGLNLPSISPRTALLLGYLISSSIFGLMHLGNENATWVSTFNIVLAGLMLGLGYLLTGELAIPIGAHITWNFFQGNVFGFPVSGMETAASFIAIEQGGPELWTGGAFGPEAGLVGIIAMALGVLLTLLWVRMRYGHNHLQERLAIYTAPAQPAQVAVEGSNDLGSLEAREEI